MTIEADSEGWIAGERPEDGSIRQVGDDCYQVRFERLIPRPIEKVWAALTIPERLHDWLGEHADIDLRVGGHYRVWFRGEGDDAVRGVITDCDPPRLLAYDWGFGNQRWELIPREDGCLLVFAGAGAPAWWALGGSAGWHVFVDQLATSVMTGARSDLDDEYMGQIEARYRRHFGPHVPGASVAPTLRHAETDGQVTSAGGGLYNLRFERFFMLPMEKLWAALTEPARLADWLAQASLDLRVDGEVELRWDTQGYAEKGFIVALDPPRLLAWAIPEPEGRHSVIRWQLRQEDPEKIGVRLILTHTLLRPVHVLGVATGWHAHLYELPEAALRAVPLPWTAARERARAETEVAQHTARYRAKLPAAVAEGCQPAVARILEEPVMNLGWYELSLDVQDIERSCAFYEKLGFQRLTPNAEKRTATVQRGNCRIGLYQGRAPEPILIFWQGDVLAIAGDLKRKQLTFETELADEKGDGALLRDPDGWAIYLVNIRGEARSGPPSKGDRRLGWFTTSLDVLDLDRSLNFYEKLGFRRVDRADIERTAMLQSGDCTLALYQGYLRPDLGRIQVTFWRGDVEGTAREWLEKGVRFESGPNRNERGAGAILKDPDGHTIHLINETSAPRTEPDRG